MREVLGSIGLATFPGAPGRHTSVRCRTRGLYALVFVVEIESDHISDRTHLDIYINKERMRSVKIVAHIRGRDRIEIFVPNVHMDKGQRLWFTQNTKKDKGQIRVLSSTVAMIDQRDIAGQSGHEFRTHE